MVVGELEVEDPVGASLSTSSELMILLLTLKSLKDGKVLSTFLEEKQVRFHLLSDSSSPQELLDKQEQYGQPNV